MKWIIIPLYLMLGLAQASDEESCDIPSLTDPTSILEIARNSSIDCKNISRDSVSPLDLKLRSKSNLCECLEKNKFNEANVDNHRKKDFRQWEYDQTLREKLNYSLNDMIGNFTKLNNLVLTKDHLGNLIDENDPICNMKTIAEDVAALQRKQGTPECPSPKGFMNFRIEEIFGTKNPADITNVLQKKTTELDSKSCITTQQYLNLRSSSGGQSTGFEKLLQESSNKSFKQEILYMTHEKSNQKEITKGLISYDVIFNLAFQDEQFKNHVKSRVEYLKSQGGNQYGIYNDTETLKQAYKALNRNCLTLTKNIKNFLCANEYPALDPVTQSMNLDDYFSHEKDKTSARSMRDYFTYDYSCNEDRRASRYRRSIRQVVTGQRARAVELSEEEQEFNSYVGNTVFLKQVTKDVFSKDPSSDYNVFNKMFCAGRQGKPVSADELPQMMKDYFVMMKEKGIDINSILSTPELASKLGLKIDINANPMFSLTSDADIQAGKLPKINEFKWKEFILPELERKGLSKEEIDQLYAIVEMQTNRRFSEIEDLKKKLIADNPAFTNYSLQDINGVVNRDPQVISRLSQPQPNTPASAFDPVTSIQQRYEALRGDVEQTSNAAQDVLFNNKDIQTLKAEAQTYNENRGTYTSTFRESGTTIQSKTATTNTTETPSYRANSSNETKTDNPQVHQSQNNGYTSQTAQTPYIPPQGNSIAGGPGSASSSEQGNKISQRPKFDEESFKNAYRDELKNLNKSNSSFDFDAESKRIQDEINRTKAESDRIQRLLDDMNRPKGNSNSNNFASDNSNWNSSSQNQYPKNVPFKNSQTGEYSYKNNDVQELSSNDPKNGDDIAREESKLAGAGKGGSPGAGGTSSENASSPESGASSGGADASGVAEVLRNLPGGAGRGPASDESEEEARKRLNLKPYEHHRIIPYAIFELVGSVDRVVLLFGLEGKQFRTIEAIETPKENEMEVKYYIRVYDFVPEGEFEEFREEFKTPESREKAFNDYFSYKRTQKNRKISQKYAKATKEISKEEVPQSYVLKIQNQIMNEEEIRDTMNKILEQMQ